MSNTLRDKYVTAIIETGAEVPTIDEDDWDFFVTAFGEITEADIERVGAEAEVARDE